MTSVEAKLKKAYSPHAWGWTAMKEEGSNGNHVFPTRVGVDRLGDDRSAG